MLIPWAYPTSVPTIRFISCIMTEESRRGSSSSAGRDRGKRRPAPDGRYRGARIPEPPAALAPPWPAGDLIGANAISQPNVGSDPSSIHAGAEPKGDRYLINGTKCWISNGHIADVVVLVAQTDPARGPAGIRQFVIDRRESPFGSRDIETIGLKAFPTSELFFEDVDILATHRLDGWSEGGDTAGDPANSFSQVLQLIAAAGSARRHLGRASAKHAFEMVLDYVKVRKQFGK